MRTQLSDPRPPEDEHTSATVQSHTALNTHTQSVQKSAPATNTQHALTKSLPCLSVGKSLPLDPGSLPSHEAFAPEFYLDNSAAVTVNAGDQPF